jgi:hypothetical protein
VDVVDPFFDRQLVEPLGRKLNPGCHGLDYTPRPDVRSRAVAQHLRRASFAALWASA